MEIAKAILTSNGDIILVDDENWELRRYPWNVGSGGYARNWELGLMHRIILGLSPEESTDHINGNRLDNRKRNLRIADGTQNNANIGKRRGQYHSKYKGVSYRKHASKWCAQIVVRYNYIHLGYFDTEKEAAWAYDEAALKYFGAYARLNNA